MVRSARVPLAPATADRSCVALEDKVWRAYGLLTSARQISSEETMEQLSMLRLGINTGVIRDVPYSKLTTTVLSLE